MRYRLLLLCLLLLATAAHAQAPSITLYCGGGFTGGGGGVMVDADGGLHRLRQPTFATPSEVTPLPGPPAPLAEWQALLDAARFESLPRGAPSNMTCSLKRGDHTVLWGGNRRFESLPQPLRTLVEAMRAVAQERATP